MEEKEADLLGIQLACDAGYDPTGSLILMQRFAKEGSNIEFLSTHPSPLNREEYLRAAAMASLKPHSEPTKTTSGVTAPEILYRSTPAYTAEARRANIRGAVSLEATIGIDGRARDVKVVKSLGYGLDESAVHTIETLWRFKPAQMDGQPVPTKLRVEVNFQP
jgi:TonB family protein